MKREIIQTADGSGTIFLPEWNEHYHSKHGAIQEARHVFMHTGLEYFLEVHRPERLSVLEIGFGTGLNALLTMIEAEETHIPVQYTGVEAYPVSAAELSALDYAEQVGANQAPHMFRKMHEVAWETEQQVTRYFALEKKKMFFSDISDSRTFDLIYYDAFGPRVQPELWTEAVFLKMFRLLNKEGVLVTYSAKGSVRRAMQTAGFKVERLPGPPGKREMLRAIKSC